MHIKVKHGLQLNNLQNSIVASLTFFLLEIGVFTFMVKKLNIISYVKVNNNSIELW